LALLLQELDKYQKMVVMVAVKTLDKPPKALI
jgi:hypothetical protein